MAWDQGACRVVGWRNRRLEGSELEGIELQRAFEVGAPPRNLLAPVRLRVGSGHRIAAHAALEIDTDLPEPRETGSDLAIGHWVNCIYAVAAERIIDASIQ